MNYSRLTKRGVGGLSAVGATLHFVEMRHDLQVFVDRCKYIISDRGRAEFESIRRDYDDIRRNLAWIDRAVRTVGQIERVAPYYLAIPSTTWHDVSAGGDRVKIAIDEAYEAYEAARQAAGAWIARAIRCGYLVQSDLSPAALDALNHYRAACDEAAAQVSAETPFEDRPGMWQVGNRGDARRQALRPMRACAVPRRKGVYTRYVSVLMTRFNGAQVPAVIAEYRAARRDVGICTVAADYAYAARDEAAMADLNRYIGALVDYERAARLKFEHRVGRASYHAYASAYAIAKHSSVACSLPRHSPARRYLARAEFEFFGGNGEN